MLQTSCTYVRQANSMQNETPHLCGLDSTTYIAKSQEAIINYDLNQIIAFMWYTQLFHASYIWMYTDVHWGVSL